MRRVSETKYEKDWLKGFGRHVRALIRKKGYKSPYDFWIKKAGDDFSRATLNFLLAGKTDPKLTTVRVLARLLGVKPSKLMDFEA